VRDVGLPEPRAGPEATHAATTNRAPAKRDGHRAAQTHRFSHLEITHRGRKQKIQSFKHSQRNNQAFYGELNISHLAVPAETVSTSKDTDTGNLFPQPPQLCNAAFLNIE